MQDTQYTAVAITAENARRRALFSAGVVLAVMLGSSAAIITTALRLA